MKPVKYKVALSEKPYTYRRKPDPRPGCVYNPEGVACDPNERNCQTCGHNPVVAANRLMNLLLPRRNSKNIQKTGFKF